MVDYLLLFVDMYHFYVLLLAFISDSLGSHRWQPNRVSRLPLGAVSLTPLNKSLGWPDVLVLVTATVTSYKWNCVRK